MRQLVVAGFAFAVLPTLSTAQLNRQLFASGFQNPVAMIQDPTDNSRFFVVQQRGLIRIIENGVVLSSNFLNLSSGTISVTGERGLLGLAFHPNYAENGYFFVNYTEINTDATRIVRFTRDPNNPRAALPASAHNVLRIPQDFGNHNGGTIAFGEDGYLYIGMGDGGSGNDPNNRAQSPTSLLGKFLRIDVDGDDFPSDPNRNYRIPPDNPFLTPNPITAAGEIWAFGMRNPWKWSFDERRLNGLGAKITADVGQNAREEINYEPRGMGGRNYGWRMMEGTLVTGLGGSAFTPWTNPIFEYTHDHGRSITGGYLYRGTDLGPAFYGRYFYADFIMGRAWSNFINVDRFTGLATAGPWTEHTDDLSDTGSVGSVSSFAIDHAGEIYLIQHSGQIHKIVPEGAPSRHLTVNLTFQGLVPTATRRPIMEVQIRQGVNVLHTYTMRADQFDTLKFPVPTGAFHISVQGGTFLRKVFAIDTTSGNAIADVSLTNGDVNGDNAVNVQDFLTLRAAFGSTVGSPGFVEGADLNGDGSVNVLDFLLLRSTFGTSGDN